MFHKEGRSNLKRFVLPSVYLMCREEVMIGEGGDKLETSLFRKSESNRDLEESGRLILRGLEL